VDPNAGLISGTATAAGSYTVALTAGNSAGSGTATLTIGINPLLTLTSPATASGQVSQSFSYQVTTSNAVTGYAAAGLPDGLSIDPAAGLISGAPTTAGTYTVTLSLTDATGTSTATLTISVAPNFPVVSGMLLWLKADTGVVANSGGLVSQWTDQSSIGNNALQSIAANQPLLVSNQFNGLPVVRFNGPNSLSLPYNMMQSAQAGEIIVVTKQTDTQDQANVLFDFGTGYGARYYDIWHYDDFGTNDISAIPPESESALQQYHVYNTSITADGTSTYSFNGVPEWTRTGLAVGFSQYPDIGGGFGGSFTGDMLEVILYSRVLSAEERVTIYGYLAQRYAMPSIVANVNSPAITSASSVTGAVGQTFDFQITASNSPTSYSATGLPPGLTIDPVAGGISGMPTVGGSWTATVIATNASGSGSSPLIFTISSSPPVITSSTTAAGQVGQAFSYQILATNNPTTYAATGLPSGVNIDTNTGYMSGILPTAAGITTVTLTATNAIGSGTATLNLIVTTSLVYSTGFELSDGFATGPLGGQNGWSVSQGTADISTQDFNSGVQSLQLASGTLAAVVVQTFPSSSGESIEFCDFYAKPAAEAAIASSSIYTVEGAQFGFQQSNGQGVLEAYYGNGSGGGAWTPTAFTVSLGPENQSTAWVRLTARLDFGAQTWDLYANGKMVAASIPFVSTPSTYLSKLQLQGDAGVATYIDDLYVGSTNPLFADVNNDGIDDAWEAQYGLSLTTNDRNGDPTGGGVTNLQKYIQGTSPLDYYNGIEPTVSPVVTGSSPGVGAPGPNDDLALLVQKPDGTPWANAPVTFQVTSGIRQFSLVQGQGPFVSTLKVQTDSTGVARIYLQPLPSQ
jgi:PKD repeat protein